VIPQNGGCLLVLHAWYHGHGTKQIKTHMSLRCILGGNQASPVVWHSGAGAYEGSSELLPLERVACSGHT
jgi:hypothetical protein